MSYEANYNTALTYMRAKLDDRALENLVKALDEVPDSDKTKDNAIYIKILFLLAKINIEKNIWSEAEKYINEGLAVKQDYADLVFFKSLCFWNRKQYDEMFGAIINYLVALMQNDPPKYEYEYGSENALEEVFGKMMPVAYKKAAGHKEMGDLVRKISEKTGNPLMQRACAVMQDVDDRREAAK